MTDHAMMPPDVSMESGLDGRNNGQGTRCTFLPEPVSMESGLDGRNNSPIDWPQHTIPRGLNGVRPRWPEQYLYGDGSVPLFDMVSMESGLDGRNNFMGRCFLDLGFLSQWSPA